MSALQPACHTSNFTNEYYLWVETDYDGCICCADDDDGPPKIGMKTTVVPAYNSHFANYYPPTDWMPTTFAPITM